MILVAIAVFRSSQIRCKVYGYILLKYFLLELVKGLNRSM